SGDPSRFCLINLGDCARGKRGFEPRKQNLRDRCGSQKYNDPMASALASIQVSGLGKGNLTALQALADSLGMSLERYARQLIEDGIALEREARSKSFDELFAPVQKKFRESKMTEEDLDELVNAARKSHHQKTSRKSA